MTEKLYMFNPWQIKKWPEDNIKEQVEKLLSKHDNEAESMYQLALNVGITANVNYLFGEMISRLTKELNLLKAKTDVKESDQLHFLRREWPKTHDEKPPAMSYFEAQAKKFVADDREKQAEIEADLMRFKKAYESMENIMNAEKKKMEAVRFEEFNK